MVQCPTCKQVLEDGIRFCPNDGTQLIETAATLADSAPTAGKRPASRDIDLPAVVGNRYRLEGLRGGGGMAKVYRAIDQTLEREVAVKLISPDLRAETEFDARFQREARIASQLADPHIVVVHDFGLDQAHGPYLVMEFLQGQSLRERLATAGPMPLKASLQMAGQLLLALIHAHNRGIVHRDIKPDNIFLLNQSGVRLHVRVLDFGIARIYRRDDSSRADTITHAGAVLGTPRYMSPEQLAGQPVDARSDLYSAALVIHEALTGQLPYVQGKKLSELCPEASPALQELLDQCLKPNPAERPPAAVEVYLRLQELGKASGILLLPPGTMDRLVAARKANEPTVPYVPEDTARNRLRRRVLIAAGLLILLLGIVALIKWLWGGPATPKGPESVAGVHLDDTLDDVESKLSLAKADDGNPWQLKRTKDHLGNALRPEDLQLDDTAIANLRIRRTGDDRVTVLFHKGKVIAVIASDRSGTGRGLRMDSDMGRLYRLYPEPGESRDVELPGGGHVEVRRYPQLGIAFEIRQGKVTGMTLYPPVK